MQDAHAQTLGILRTFKRPHNSIETKVSIIFIANKVSNERIDIKTTYQLGKNASTFKIIVCLSFVKNDTLLLNTSQYYVSLSTYIINF